LAQGGTAVSASEFERGVEIHILRRNARQFIARHGIDKGFA
jgi:hypothetical protein